MEHRYGMRMRGAAPGAQPKDFREIQEDTTGRYHDVLVYDRELTQEEQSRYELEPIEG